MPHLQLEFSSNVAPLIDVEGVLNELVDELAGFDTVESRAIKAYARVCESWAMGSGAKEGFIHLTLCVLDGRDPSLLAQMADGLYHRLRTACHQAWESGKAGLTVEVRQMDRATYRK